MASRRSVANQVIHRMDQMFELEFKKYEYKQAKMKEFEEMKAKGIEPDTKFNPAKIEGKIVSQYAYKSYKPPAIMFSKWCEKEHGITKITKMDKPHLMAQWLKTKQDAGMSASTLRTYQCAIMKVIGRDKIPVEKLYEQGWSCPTRVSKEFTKYRYDEGKAQFPQFSVKNNSAVVDFCLGTGVRRHELLAIKPENIRQTQDGKVFVTIEKGKGGKFREVQVRPGFESVVMNAKEGKLEGESIFKKGNQEQDANGKIIKQEKGDVAKRMPVHYYRKTAAIELYKQLATEKIQREGALDFRKGLAAFDKGGYYTKDGRVFDREILLRVSEFLGHNRCDVVVKNYFSEYEGSL